MAKPWTNWKSRMAKDKNSGNGTPLDVEHEIGSGTADDFVENQAGAPESGPRAVNSEVNDVEALAEQLKAENAQYLDRLARLQAEFDNFRKRSAREQQDFRDYALVEALKQLLPLLDSLDRALKTEGATAEDFRSGIDLIDRQFHQVLEKLGVEPIEAAGKPFDPTVHQAIQMVDTDEVPDNHVVDELQRGYKIRERLLRPAMVRVAQNANKK
jgi:molecular chaperone GrpE